MFRRPGRDGLLDLGAAMQKKTTPLSVSIAWRSLFDLPESSAIKTKSDARFRQHVSI